MSNTVKKIGAWEVKLSEKSNVLNIVVSNEDESQVVDADNTSLGDEYEFAISMTSHQIEDDYKALEEAGRACEPVCGNQDDNVEVGDWEIELVVDEDSHLALFITAGDGIEVKLHSDIKEDDGKLLFSIALA